MEMLKQVQHDEFERLVEMLKQAKPTNFVNLNSFQVLHPFKNNQTNQIRQPELVSGSPKSQTSFQLQKTFTDFSFYRISAKLQRMEMLKQVQHDESVRLVDVIAN